jgi:hypothetical protein
MWGQSGDDVVGSALMGQNPNVQFGAGFVLKTGAFLNHRQSSLKGR